MDILLLADEWNAMFVLCDSTNTLTRCALVLTRTLSFLFVASTGSLLGQKDLRFLRNSYILFFFTVPAYMLRLKRRSLLGLQDVGIGTMWAAFSTYNVIRTFIWHLRLTQLQRRTERGVVRVGS